MFQCFNSHPEGKVNTNGIIIAVSKIFDISWLVAFSILSLIGTDIIENPESFATLDVYLKSNYFKQKNIDCEKHSKIKYTIKDFCRDYPKGSYIVMTNNYATAVIDGDYYGINDTGNEIVICYWEK